LFVRAQHACRWTPPEVFPATGSLLTSGDPALLERTAVKLCERVYRIRFLGTEAVKCGSRRIGPDRGARRAPFRREWRRGESNRPVEDGGGRRSKLRGHLSRGRLPPSTLPYRQFVPEGQRESVRFEA